MYFTLGLIHKRVEAGNKNNNRNGHRSPTVTLLLTISCSLNSRAKGINLVWVCICVWTGWWFLHFYIFYTFVSSLFCMPLNFIQFFFKWTATFTTLPPPNFFYKPGQRCLVALGCLCTASPKSLVWSPGQFSPLSSPVAHWWPQWSPSESSLADWCPADHSLDEVFQSPVSKKNLN